MKNWESFQVTVEELQDLIRHLKDSLEKERAEKIEYQHEALKHFEEIQSYGDGSSVGGQRSSARKTAVSFCCSTRLKRFFLRRAANSLMNKPSKSVPIADTNAEGSRCRPRTLA